MQRKVTNRDNWYAFLIEVVNSFFTTAFTIFMKIWITFPVIYRCFDGILVYCIIHFYVYSVYDLL